MTESAAPLPVDRLYGVGIVAGELASTLESFSRFFGIEEWEVRRLQTGKNFAIESRGRDISAELLLATGRANGVSFDVVVPVGGETVFSEYLESRGPGAHDLSTNLMSQQEFERILPELGRNGLSILQTLRIGDDLDIHYLDSAGQLATVVKILVPRRPGGESLGAVPIEQVIRIDPGPAAGRLPIEAAYHVCINTRHRRASVQEAFRRIFGIERWFDYDNETGVSVEQAHYFGKQADARFRLSCGRRGDFSVEVVEMIFGDSVYEDMLAEKGEGIHHLFTTVCTMDTLDQAKGALSPHGYSIVQDGCVGSIYYGYLAAPGKMAGLSVEMLCPLAGDWTEEAGDDFWQILLGEDYKRHPLVA